MVEGATGVVVPSRGVVLVVDGTGRVGSALDAGLCPVKELVAIGGISIDSVSSGETSIPEHTGAKQGKGVARILSKSARVASKTGLSDLISELTEVDSGGVETLAARARSSLTIYSGVIGCIIIF